MSRRRGTTYDAGYAGQGSREPRLTRSGGDVEGGQSLSEGSWALVPVSWPGVLTLKLIVGARHLT